LPDTKIRLASVRPKSNFRRLTTESASALFESLLQNSKVKIMKRSFLIVIGPLAPASFLIGDITWPTATFAG